MGIRTIAYRYDDLIRVHSLVLYAGLRARVQVVELASYRSRLRAVSVFAPVCEHFRGPVIILESMQWSSLFSVVM